MSELEKELRDALAAMKMRAEAAEIYLAQAEARIAELEAELAKDVKISQIGVDFGTDLGDIEKYYTDKPRRQGKSAEQKERYKRKAQDVQSAAEAFERQQQYESLQRWLAAAGPELGKVAEKYLNAFRDQPPLGTGDGPQKDYAGGRYKIVAHGYPGKVEFRVSGANGSMAWTQNFADNVDFLEFQSRCKGFIPDMMDSLGIPDTQRVREFLLNDFTICMARIRNGKTTHTIERGSS